MSQQLKSLASALADSAVAALDGWAVDGDFERSSNSSEFAAVERALLRVLVASPVVSLPHEVSLAKQWLQDGFRAFRVGNETFVMNFRQSAHVAFAGQEIKNHWPAFPYQILSSLEFLTSLEG